MGARAQEAVSFRSKQTDINLLRLLGILAAGADDETGLVDPAPNRETLAEVTGCTPRTITNRIGKLIESGELVQVRMGSGPGNPSAYRLLLDIPETTCFKQENNPDDYEQKGEKGENLTQKVDRIGQELAELKALFFTLLNTKSETKGEKGGNALVELSADDPYSDPEEDTPPTPPGEEKGGGESSAYAEATWNYLLKLYDQRKAVVIAQAQNIYSQASGVKQPYLNGRHEDAKWANLEWWQPLDKMIAEVEGSYDLFESAVKEVFAIADAKGLSISAPATATKTFTSIVGRWRRQGGQARKGAGQNPDGSYNV